MGLGTEKMVDTLRSKLTTLLNILKQLAN